MNARAVRRKLHARELVYLRELTAELLAERWRDDALQAIEHAGARPGLTVDGRLHCLTTP